MKVMMMRQNIYELLLDSILPTAIDTDSKGQRRSVVALAYKVQNSKRGIYLIQGSSQTIPVSTLQRPNITTITDAQRANAAANAAMRTPAEAAM